MREAAHLAWNWASEQNFTGSQQKVVNEAKEFAEAPSLEEAADVFIALVVACQKQGWTVGELHTAALAKMAINFDRTWALADDGTYQHTD